MKDALSVVGQNFVPVYAAAKSTGTVKFPADISLPGMLWMKLARTPHAHARILEIDTSRAEQMWGVVKVLTYKDVPRVLFGPYKDELYPLDEEVSFVGDSVAAVAAEDWNIAEEAMRVIRVNYEQLPAVFDIEAATKDDSPMSTLHLPDSERGLVERHPSATMAMKNAPMSWAGQIRNPPGSTSAAIWTKASKRVTSSSNGFFIKLTSALCRMNRAAAWQSATTTSVLSGVRSKIHSRFKARSPRFSVCRRNRCRIVSSIIGGGFGVKVLGRFAVLAALMARETKRPVKVWFTREEESLDSHNRSALVHYVKAGTKKDGSLTAFKVRTYMDNGFWMFGGLGENIAKSICTRPMDLYRKIPNVLVGSVNGAHQSSLHRPLPRASGCRKPFRRGNGNG